LLNVNELLWLLRLQQLESSLSTLVEENPANSGESFAAVFSAALNNYLPGNLTSDIVQSPDPPGQWNYSSYDDIIKDAARKYNLDPDLIRSIIKAESNFNPNARSTAGAQGLMQLMPATAKEMGIKNPLDPVQNIFGGARYLRKMLDSFHNNQQLAIAAYNAGPGNVRKYGGIPPFRETQNYVKKVLGNNLDTLV